MFNKLNDDCLLKILSYVKDIRDQMALRHVCSSLYNNVHYHWSHVTELGVDEPEIEYFQEHPADMHAFMEHASESLTTVILSQSNNKILSSWMAYDFPNVLSLDCELFCTDNDPDEDVRLLTKLFPDIIHFSLQSSATGKHIWQFKQLSSLHFYCCESLDPVMMERIFAKLPLRKLTLLFYGYSANLGDGLLGASQCRTLTELVIDDHHLLGEFMPNLVKLPYFRKLAFYTRDYYEHLLQSVARLQPLRVEALSFFDAFWSSDTLCDNIHRMRNLRRLVLSDDDIGASQLQTICSRLKNLEELHLITMRALPTTHQIWAVVEATPSLRLLNLSSCQLDKDFLKHSTSRLPKVLKNRSKRPLTINLCDTFVEGDMAKTQAALKHPNLKISYDYIDLNGWTSRFIEIGFETISGLPYILPRIRDEED